MGLSLDGGPGLKWIVWLWDFRSWEVRCPLDKVSKGLQLLLCFSSTQVARADVVEAASFFLWLTDAFPYLRPWISIWYTMLL